MKDTVNGPQMHIKLVLSMLFIVWRQIWHNKCLFKLHLIFSIVNTIICISDRFFTHLPCYANMGGPLVYCIVILVSCLGQMENSGFCICNTQETTAASDKPLYTNRPTSFIQ